MTSADPSPRPRPAGPPTPAPSAHRGERLRGVRAERRHEADPGHGDGAGFALEHPAAALGDVGAATGAALVALAVEYLRTKHADRAGAVVWAAAEDGERRAMALERA